MTHTNTRARMILVLAAVLFAETGVLATQVLMPSENQSAYVLQRPGSSVSSSRARSSMSSRPILHTAARKIIRPKVIKNRTSRRELLEKTPAYTGTGTTRNFSSIEYKKSRCGDRLVVDPEVCDDGNTVNNDGCSSSCQVETGFECNKSQPSICTSQCGDGVVATNEQCDDGNTSYADGCGGDCKTRLGYKCSGSPSTCTEITQCGNGVKETGEACDDGNSVNTDGCTTSCQLQ